MENKKEMVLYSADLNWGKRIPKLEVKLSEKEYCYYLDSMSVSDNYKDSWGDDFYDSYFRDAITHAIKSLGNINDFNDNGNVAFDLKKNILNDAICDIKNVFELVELYKQDYIEIDGCEIHIDEFDLKKLQADVNSLIETLAAVIDDIDNDKGLIEVILYAIKSQSSELRKLVSNIELIQKIVDYRLFAQDRQDSAERFYRLIHSMLRTGRNKKAGRFNIVEKYYYFDSKIRSIIDRIKVGKFDFNIAECMGWYKGALPSSNGYASFKEYLLNCEKGNWDDAINEANNYVSYVSMHMNFNNNFIGFRLEVMIAMAMREQLAHHYIVLGKEGNLLAIARRYRAGNELRSIDSYLRELNLENKNPTNKDISEIANLDDLIEKLWGLLKLSDDNTVFTGGRDNNNPDNSNKNSRPEIGKVAYYTKLDTLGYLLPQTCKVSEEGILSMMHIAYMNDPNEGKVITKHVFGGIKRKDARDDARYPYVFLKSFTRRIDDLPMWEIYGGRAEGVCLVVDPKQFTDKNTHTPMYYVCYLRKKEDVYYIDAEDNNNLSPKALAEIEKILKKIKNSARRHSRNKAFLAAIDTAIQQVKFMFKDADYSHERELRIVYIAARQDDPRIKQTLNPETGTSIKPLTYEEGKTPKLYVSDIGPVVIDEIIFGPKSKNAPNELPFLERRCDQLSQKYRTEYDGKNIKITFSDINYR